MKITRIDAKHYRIPLPVVLSDSIHGDMPDFELVTVQVETSEGVSGTGYTYTVGRGGSAIRALIADDLASVVLGQDAADVEALWDRMWWAIHWVGRGGLAAFAMAAVDVALWDIRAKAAHLPLWRLLGGTNPRVKCYAGGIDLQFPLDRLLEQTQGFLDAGFRAIKVKVGRDDAREDAERVCAVRRMVGADFTLMADANCRWTAEQAIDVSRRLAGPGLYWLEEPTIPDDVEGFARIAAEGGQRLATGENMHTTYEFERMIRCGGISFAQPDLANLGGITPWLAVARMAAARGLPVTSHGVHDLHVHLLAAVPNADYLEVHGFGLERFQEDPMQFRDGDALAPDRPGHGVELIWAKLAPYRRL